MYLLGSNPGDSRSYTRHKAREDLKSSVLPYKCDLKCVTPCTCADLLHFGVVFFSTSFLLITEVIGLVSGLIR